MIVTKSYITVSAAALIHENRTAEQAYNEVIDSISSITSRINNSSKNCNGVMPLKDNCYQKLENDYLWFREKPLEYFHEQREKGGPIDVYKEFENPFTRVGLEFETGNISSAHRAMNKLSVGIKQHELDLAVLIMPVARLSYYLTDRVSNYEELEPYYILLEEYPFIILGFDAEQYINTTPLLPKGPDGMSHRSIRKWDTRRV
jgi:hypothetical protein